MCNKTTRINSLAMNGQQNRLFYDVNTTLIETVEQRLQKGDDAAALNALHSIRGAVQIIGASALAQAVRDVVDAIEAGRRGDAQECITKLRKEFDAFRPVATEWTTRS